MQEQAGCRERDCKMGTLGGVEASRKRITGQQEDEGNFGKARVNNKQAARRVRGSSRKRECGQQTGGRSERQEGTAKQESRGLAGGKKTGEPLYEQE